MSDWELWDKARFIGSIFDQKSSCRRARIGLYWRNKHEHARHGSPWHPVEDSGRKNKDPGSNKATVIWQIKDRYKDMPYDDWAHDYRNLAKGSIEEPLAEV